MKKDGVCFTVVLVLSILIEEAVAPYASLRSVSVWQATCESSADL
jgi:hypothetical protein